MSWEVFHAEDGLCLSQLENLATSDSAEKALKVPVTDKYIW